MHIRLSSFLTEEHDLIYENQYGFREKNLTYMVLLNIIDKISDVMN